MLDVNYIPDEVLTSILRNKELDESDESYALVSKLSVHEAFNSYLTWKGIIGFTTDFIAALDGLRQAELSAILTSNETKDL